MTPESSQTTKDAILARIRDEGITPRPRWHFLAREGVVWTLGGISVAIGAGATAAIIFETHHAGWDYYEATHPSLWSFVMGMLPYMWFLMLALFAASAYLFVRHTKHGYRYSYVGLLLAPILASGLSGTFLYVAGLGEYVEDSVGGYIPFHLSVRDRERTLWSLPEEGRLTGEVFEIALAEKRIFSLEAADGNVYDIHVGAFREQDLARVAVGDHMRVIGIPTTTPGVLEGCIIFVRNDDILRMPLREHKGRERAALPPRGSPERNTFFARSTECQGIPPFARFVHLERAE